MRMVVIALSLLGTLVMTPLPVRAASTTITLLDQRLRASRAQSIIWDAPAQLSGWIVLETDLVLADLLNPLTKVELRLEDETGFILEGFTYAGGNFVNPYTGLPAGNPKMGFDARLIAGRKVRLVILPNRAMTIGAHIISTDTAP